MQPWTMWRQVPFLDMDRAWQNVNHTECPSSDRLRHLLITCGVSAHDADGLYIKEPRVLLRSMSGLPVRLETGPAGPVTLGAGGVPIEIALQDLSKTMGIAAMDSYLNPRQRTAHELLERNVELHGMPSVAHTVHLGLFIAGLSAKAELELACQRDIVHLSRLTSARTIAQDNPPILVEDRTMLDYYRASRILLDQACPILPGMTQAEREIRNSAWPLAKCSILGITGSIKNLTKLSALADDDGKEDEVRRICLRIGEILKALTPELFTSAQIAEQK